MNRICLFLFLLPGICAGIFFPFQANAGERHTTVFVPEAHQFIEVSIPGMTFAAEDNPESLIIPLKRAGNLILIEAIIDSIPGNLIFDTGSATLLLNSMYFRHRRSSGLMIAGGVTGITGSVVNSRIQKLQISDLVFHKIEADITDLGHLESARNIKILGLFGISLLSDYETVIDIQNNVMELHRLDFRGNRLSRDIQTLKPDIQVPLRIESGVLFIDAVIRSRKLTFCLDTGSEINALGNHLPNSVLNSLQIIRRANIRGVRAQQVEVIYAAMTDFSISGVNLPGMNTIITNLSSMSQTFGVRIDGMLGYDFLEQGIIYINPKKRQLQMIRYKNGEEQP